MKWNKLYHKSKITGQNAFSLLLVFFLLAMGCTKENEQYYHFKNNAGSFNGDAIDFLNENRDGLYDSMLLAIQRVSGLEDSIRQGNITLFALTNTSFELALNNLNEVRDRNVPPRAPLSIVTLDSAQLDTLLFRYVLKEPLLTDTISQFADGLPIECLKYDYLMQVLYRHENSSGYEEGGPELLVLVDRNESIFDRFWVEATTNAVDIKTSNSIVHVLSPGHDFGFGQMVERMNK